MKFRHLAILALTGALAACSKPAPEPGVYPVSLHDAYQRLEASDLPEFSFANQCGILIHVRPVGQPESSVTWYVYSSGEEMLHFTATLIPVGADKTKVDISVSSDKDGKEAYDGDHFYTRPALRQPTRPSIREAISALLEGRKYDPTVQRGSQDTVCNVQRGGLESGLRFTIHDKPGEPL